MSGLVKFGVGVSCMEIRKLEQKHPEEARKEKVKAYDLY